MAQNQFDERDAEEILKRAAAMDGNAQIDRGLIERTAAELGISAESLARAEAEYMQDREQRRDREEFLEERRRSVMTQLATYIPVMLFLTGIWYFSRSGYFWPIWPMMGWGLGIVLQLIQVRLSTGPQFEKEFAEWRARRSLR